MMVTCAVVDTGEDEHGECEDGRADGADNISVIPSILRKRDDSTVRHQTFPFVHL